jgi:hypothetical protein
MTITLTDTSHLNVGGAAQILGCTRHRTLTLSARGFLKPVTIGGQVYFLRSEIEALRDQLAAQGAAKVKATKRARSRSA